MKNVSKQMYGVYMYTKRGAKYSIKIEYKQRCEKAKK